MDYGLIFLCEPSNNSLHLIVDVLKCQLSTKMRRLFAKLCVKRAEMFVDFENVIARGPY